MPQVKYSKNAKAFLNSVYADWLLTTASKIKPNKTYKLEIENKDYYLKIGVEIDTENKATE